MGADLIEHATGEFSRAVFVKGGSGDPSVCAGTVDSVTAAPTFTVASLSGYGNDYFDSWYAYVAWDKDGAAAAPQGESQAITGYTSSTGTFAHAAFTAPLVAGDKILISLSDPNAPGDATAANQTTIITDTEKIYDVALGVSPVDGSLASFIATGGTALGTRLPASKSLYDVVALDRLDHATYGLSALDTELALIPQSGGAVSWNATALAAIQAEAEDALEGEDLDHLLKLDSAAQKYPVNCATDSVVAKMLAKGDPAVPSTYDCTTDSLQALSDKSGGFSGDGGAAQDDSVKASLDLAHTDLDTIIAAQTVGIKKNVQRTIVFKMVDATDFATPETGITVTEEISKDGGAFAACANAFSEIANGWYKITLTATEMNASEIIFKGTSAGCAQCDRLIVTES